ncbi:MAG: ribosome maturation factor RimP [Pseudomonadota bacterium]
MKVVKLVELLEPSVEALGFELVDLLYRSGKGGLLRIYIDKESGEIDLDDCELVSRQVSSLLDVEDPMPGNYTLEVSSPGFDRPLRKKEHFARFIGSEAKLVLHTSLEGRRNFRGVLSQLIDDDVVMQVDGEEFRISLQAIDQARLVPDYKLVGE